jgi:hypothetical protein
VTTTKKKPPQLNLHHRHHNDRTRNRTSVASVWTNYHSVIRTLKTYVPPVAESNGTRIVRTRSKTV